MKRYEFNEGDVIEAYNVKRNASVAKYIVARKISTKYKGDFYDLISIPREQDDATQFLPSFRLRTGGVVEYRIFEHGRK